MTETKSPPAKRVPAWTIAIPGYEHTEYVLIKDGDGLRMPHRLTPIQVAR